MLLSLNIPFLGAYMSILLKIIIILHTIKAII